jgi:hypothetical protein
MICHSCPRFTGPNLCGAPPYQPTLLFNGDRHPCTMSRCWHGCRGTVPGFASTVEHADFLADVVALREISGLPPTRICGILVYLDHGPCEVWGGYGS